METTITNLKNHVVLIRYFKNTGWMMGEQCLRIIAGIFVGVWVARYLGPEKFGTFSYVIAFTAMFSGIAKLGLDHIIVRELVNHPTKRDYYLGTAFWLKILGAFIVICLMAAAVTFTTNDASTNLYISIITAGLIFQSFEIVEFYFQSQVLAKIICICKIIQLTFSSIIKIYLVITEAELLWIVVVTAFDTFSLAISYIIAYQLRNRPIFYNKFDLSIAKQLLNNSWPLILSTIMISIYTRIDQIMIKELIGEYELGLYSAAARLIEILIIPASVLISSLSPHFLRNNIQNEYLAYSKLSQVVMILGGFIIITSLIGSDLFYKKTFGTEYNKSSEYFNLLLLSLPFVYLSMPFSTYFVRRNLLHFQLAVVFASVLLNILLNYYLIPAYGVYGAIYSTIIARLSTSLSIFVIDRKLFYIQVRSLLFLNINRGIYK